MPVHVNINPLSWESAFFGVDTVRLEPQGDIPLEQALR
ncbi:MAG TPA: TDP-fucosamine acetyltransferase, partial [Pantoea agglomerans]|nr:TDP-fucosamine acetyltransferase [Pantoea agglomerans]